MTTSAFSKSDLLDLPQQVPIMEFVHWRQVGMYLACTHLKLDACLSVTLVDQPALSQHLVCQQWGRHVQNDDIQRSWRCKRL